MEALVGLVIGGIAKIAQIGLEAAAASTADRESVRASLIAALVEFQAAVELLPLEIAKNDADADAGLAEKFKAV